MIAPWEALLDIACVAALLLLIFVCRDRKRNPAKAWHDETEHWRAHAGANRDHTGEQCGRCSYWLSPSGECKACLKASIQAAFGSGAER